MKSKFDRQRTTAPLVVTATAFTSSSTSAVQINPNGIGGMIVRFLPTQDCYIKFGTASVGAATSSDWPLIANKVARLIVGNDSTYFTVIRKSADGTLDWYVEGRAE